MKTVNTKELSKLTSNLETINVALDVIKHEESLVFKTRFYGSTAEVSSEGLEPVMLDESETRALIEAQKVYLETVRGIYETMAKNTLTELVSDFGLVLPATARDAEQNSG